MLYLALLQDVRHTSTNRMTVVSSHLCCPQTGFEICARVRSQGAENTPERVRVGVGASRSSNTKDRIA